MPAHVTGVCSTKDCTRISLHLRTVGLQRQHGGAGWPIFIARRRIGRSHAARASGVRRQRVRPSASASLWVLVRSELDVYLARCHGAATPGSASPLQYASRRHSLCKENLQLPPATYRNATSARRIPGLLSLLRLRPRSCFGSHPTRRNPRHAQHRQPGVAYLAEPTPIARPPHFPAPVFSCAHLDS